MAVSKLTIIATLRDELTGPLKKATKELLNTTKATERSAIATEAQTRAFNRAAKAAGYRQTQEGRWRQANGRYVSQTKLAALAEDVRAKAAARAAKESGLLARGIERLTRRMMGGNEGMLKAGIATENLAKKFRLTDRAAANFGTRVTTTLDRLPHAARRSADAFGRSLSYMASNAERAATKIEGAVGRMGKRSALPAAAVGAFTLAGGMQRIVDQQTADVKLNVMDFDEKGRADIIEGFRENVLGTPFGLGEAASTGTQLLAAMGGDPQGDELDTRMNTLVDLASFTGRDLADIALPVSQITAKGNLTGEEAMQMNERGVPIYDWIAKYKGVDTSEVMDMISNKEVSTQDFWNAMKPKVEGSAELMGETLSGQFRNMRASFSRAGETFLLPMLDPMKNSMGEVINLLDGAAPFFESLGHAGAKALGRFAEVLPTIGDRLALMGPSFSRLFEAVVELLPAILEGTSNWLLLLTPLIVLLTEFTALLLQMTGPLLPALIPLLAGSLLIFRGLGILKFVGGHLKTFVLWLVRLYAPLWKFLGKSALLRGVFQSLVGLLPRASLALAGFSRWMTLMALRGAILLRSIGGLRGAFMLLGGVLRAHPIMLIATIIIAVVQALGWLYDNVEIVRDAFDWVSDSIQAAGKWLDEFGDKIGKFVEEKLPWLHEILNFWKDNPLTRADEWLKNTGNQIGQDSGLHEALGTGEHSKSGEGVFRFGQGSGTKETNDEFLVPRSDKPIRTADDVLERYADGGWTAGGAHVVGERGTEFITNAWASNKMAVNSPGALEYINATGELPTGGNVTIAPTIRIDGAQDPAAIAAHVEAALRRYAREAERTYMTPAARGAN